MCKCYMISKFNFFEKKNYQLFIQQQIKRNFFSKYKIGMAILFSLPKQRSNSSSTSSSPLSTSMSPSSTPISHAKNAKSKNQLHKQQSYDPIVMFPSSPPLPSTPMLNGTNVKSNNNGSTIDLADQLQTSNE